jgi:hypothetical protein
LSVNDESVSPPVPGDRYYVVPQLTTDAQGNERAGVKMPDIAVPLATFTGYNLRKPGYVAGQQNGLNSSQLAFATTPSTRKPGDPVKVCRSCYWQQVGISRTRSTARWISWFAQPFPSLSRERAGVDDPAELPQSRADAN